jgi:phage-related baseplate assembly protein
MSGFTAIELDKLPSPSVVEVLDYEVILAELKASLLTLDSNMASVLELESETATKLLQVAALREMVLRQRINEASKAVMLAYAIGPDLDQIGARYNVQRLLIDAGDPNAFPPIEPTYEADNDFRRRVQLSLEGFSTAGPEGAYVFHALSADGDVLDASATSPTPGNVLITVLSRTDDGSAVPALLAAVDTTLSADDVRPLTDNVSVQGATIQAYAVDATLYFYSGPDSAVVMAQASKKLDEYVAANHRLGHDVTLSGIYAALHQPGVQRVQLNSPAADIVVSKTAAAYCNNITLVNGGNDE